MVSFFPTAMLNYRYSGNWTGMSVESNEIKMNHLLHGMIGNSLLIAL
jgi:hypothetical protein